MNLREKKTKKDGGAQLLHPFQIGKSYIVRTVSFANVGKLKDIKGNWLIMSAASWIADTGSWADCLQKANSFKQVEPFKDDVYINIDAIIDATPFNHKLPDNK
jgi:hypothetical protein